MSINLVLRNSRFVRNRNEKHSGPEPRKPVSSRIVSLHAENNHLQLAVSGGLIDIPTKFDPMLCRADRLVGQVLGAIEKFPKVYTEEKKQTKVSKLAKNELPVTNIGSTSTSEQVMGVRGDLAKVQLTLPVRLERMSRFRDVSRSIGGL
ncbi:hypothetical protein EV424DRAFT_1135125 [Suillus variegatus]|nr:hypothetical protein EV424DRAFT_1135125 [Suillus variegatus]